MVTPNRHGRRRCYTCRIVKYVGDILVIFIFVDEEVRFIVAGSAIGEYHVIKLVDVQAVDKRERSVSIWYSDFTSFILMRNRLCGNILERHCLICLLTASLSST